MSEADSILEDTIREVADPTPEGLAVRRLPLENGGVLLQEVGHFDYVIFEHRAFPPAEYHQDGGFWVGGGRSESGVEYLAERIVDLQVRCRKLEQEVPPSIDLALWKRNLRAARRRLRRWLTTNQPTSISLPLKMQAIVRDVLDTAPEKEFEFPSELIEKNVGMIYAYERRKAGAGPLLVASIPGQVLGLLEEAREAYFHGLFSATIVLCRALLEELLKDVLSREEVSSKALPIFEDRLEILINCLPEDLLKSGGRRYAHEIRWQGNRALHEAATFSDEEAYAALYWTSRIVEVILNRAEALKAP